MMPSRFEPCGLNQLYSLRYGTLPLVYATGGLVDTVKQVNDTGSKGTGFLFKQYTQTALLGTIDFALSLYGKPKTWEKIVKRAMSEDFSLKAMAEKYDALYETMIATSKNITVKNIPETDPSL